jgi:uncharacterized repeat protein (TIGR01451 family)
MPDTDTLDREADEKSSTEADAPSQDYMDKGIENAENFANNPGDEEDQSSGGSSRGGVRQARKLRRSPGSAPRPPITAGGGNAAGGGAKMLLREPHVLAAVLIVVGIVVLIMIIIMLATGGGAKPKSETENQIRLTISKNGPTEASSGQELTYQIAVGYAGRAQDISVTDRIPDGTDYIDSTPPAKYDSATRIATWNLKDYEASPEAGLNNVNTTLTLRLRATTDNLFLVNQASGNVVGAGYGGPVSGDIVKLLPNPIPPDPEGIEEAKNEALSAITQHKGIYEQVAAATGVPWQVFAGIHFREGGAAPNTSLVSGRPIGGNEPDVVDGPGCSSDAPQGVDDGIPEPFSGGCKFASMLDSGLYGGNLLKGKVGGEIGTFEILVKALSRYNGGGNSNCGKGVPYNGCPRLFEGEDDPYALNFFDSKHKPMYKIYCYDYTKCDPPFEDPAPGTATVAKWAAQDVR